MRMGAVEKEKERERDYTEEAHAITNEVEAAMEQPALHM